MPRHGRPRRLREFRPGDRVVVVQDWRGTGELTGRQATYEGRFDADTGRRWRKSGTEKRENILRAVPRLRLDDGTLMSGLDGWWKRDRTRGRTGQADKQSSDVEECERMIAADRAEDRRLRASGLAPTWLGLDSR